MKQIILTEEEAKMLVEILKHNWVPPSQQKVVYNLINRIERELEIE